MPTRSPGNCSLFYAPNLNKPSTAIWALATNCTKEVKLIWPRLRRRENCPPGQPLAWAGLRLEADLFGESKTKQIMRHTTKHKKRYLPKHIQQKMHSFLLDAFRLHKTHLSESYVGGKIQHLHIQKVTSEGKLKSAFPLGPFWLKPPCFRCFQHFSTWL